MATLIGQAAPNFKAVAYLPNGEFGDVELADYVGKKHVVLYWYPLDFTFVCASELIAFSNLKAEFDARKFLIFFKMLEKQSLCEFMEFFIGKLCLYATNIFEIIFK